MSYFVVRCDAGSGCCELVMGGGSQPEAERVAERFRRGGNWAGVYSAPVGSVALRRAEAAVAAGIARNAASGG